MSLDRLTPVDDPIDMPKGEGAFVPFAQLCQVSRFDGQQIQIDHDAITRSSEPMANGTVLAKLSFSGRHHLCFLRQARSCPQPGHHKQPRQTSRFSPPPCLPLRFHNWERGLKHLVSPALKLSAFTSAPRCQTWTL